MCCGRDVHRSLASKQDGSVAGAVKWLLLAMVHNDVLAFRAFQLFRVSCTGTSHKRCGLQCSWGQPALEAEVKNGSLPAIFVYVPPT